MIFDIVVNLHKVWSVDTKMGENIPFEYFLEDVEVLDEVKLTQYVQNKKLFLLKILPIREIVVFTKKLKFESVQRTKWQFHVMQKMSGECDMCYIFF